MTNTSSSTSSIMERLEFLGNLLQSVKSQLADVQQDFDRIALPADNESFTEEEVRQLIRAAYERGFEDCQEYVQDSEYTENYSSETFSVRISVTGDTFLDSIYLDRANDSERIPDTMMRDFVSNRLPSLPKENSSIL